MLINKLHNNFVVIGEAENLKDGRALIVNAKPDLVFVDIKMPDGNGFDLIAEFHNAEFEVIYITGFDEYQLKAKLLNAFDYILKPIDLDNFKIALNRVEARINAKRSF